MTKMKCCLVSLESSSFTTEAIPSTSQTRLPTFLRLSTRLKTWNSCSNPKIMRRTLTEIARKIRKTLMLRLELKAKSQKTRISRSMSRMTRRRTQTLTLKILRKSFSTRLTVHLHQPKMSTQTSLQGQGLGIIVTNRRALYLKISSLAMLKKRAMLIPRI